jgi:hypothetical protein
VSQQIQGQHLWIGGTFAAELENLGGELGEYSFLAKSR